MKYLGFSWNSAPTSAWFTKNSAALCPALCAELCDDISLLWFVSSAAALQIAQSWEQQLNQLDGLCICEEGKHKYWTFHQRVDPNSWGNKAELWHVKFCWLHSIMTFESSLETAHRHLCVYMNIIGKPKCSPQTELHTQTMLWVYRCPYRPAIVSCCFWLITLV